MLILMMITMITVSPSLIVYTNTSHNTNKAEEEEGRARASREVKIGIWL